MKLTQFQPDLVEHSFFTLIYCRSGEFRGWHKDPDDSMTAQLFLPSYRVFPISSHVCTSTRTVLQKLSFQHILNSESKLFCRQGAGKSDRSDLSE